MLVKKDLFQKVLILYTGLIFQSFIHKNQVVVLLFLFSASEKAVQSLLKISQEYTEYATIQGLAYIFSPHISVFGKIYWILSVLVMISVGMYWTVGMYTRWQEQQVKILVFERIFFCG